MIKALLFDYGGVVTAGGAGNELSERLAVALDISPEEAFGLLGLVWTDYAKGKISEETLWQTIEKNYGKAIHPSKWGIWNTWGEHMQPQPEMLALIGRLRSEGYTVGLLSNVIPNTAADIRAHGGYEIFDFLILSCEVGYAKPDKEIYELALAKLPAIPASEVVFIDDQERCLAPARKLGMQTILAQSPGQIDRDITQLLESSV